MRLQSTLSDPLPNGCIDARVNKMAASLTALRRAGAPDDVGSMIATLLSDGKDSVVGLFVALRAAKLRASIPRAD